MVRVVLGAAPRTTLGFLRKGRETVTKTKVKAVLMKIIVDQKLTGKTDLPDHTRFVEDLQADSLDSLELAMEISDAFEIEIPDDDVSKLKTVGETVNYVFQKLAAKRK